MKEKGTYNLHFFDKATMDKCIAVAKSLGIHGTTQKLSDDSYKFKTEPLTATDRRKFISKWADVSVERIG